MKDQGGAGRRLPWPVLVVNLDRSPERWRHAESAYSRAGFAIERLVAIDGEMLTAGDLAAAVDAERNRRLYKRPLTRGEIGCYLSHREAWRRIVADGAQGGYVFEDDTEPTEMLVQAMALVEGRAIDWDIVKLFSGRPPSGRVVAEAGALSLRRPAVLPAGTVGYAISRQGAAKLLHLPARFFRPLDMDIKHWWEQELRVLVVDPPVLRSSGEDIGESTIEAGRLQARRNSFARFVLNARYQARFRLNLYVRQVRHLLTHAVSERGSREP
jgi:glycosyl transferase family 25